MAPAGNLDWVFGLLGWAFGGGGAVLLLRALLRDRSRGRRRCPGCWYEMAGVPGLRCPECGTASRSERAFRRTRRRWRWAAAAAAGVAAGLVVGSVPGYRDKGWVGLVPSSVLVFIAPVRASGTAWPPATPPAWAGANAWALLPPRAPALPVTAAEEMRAEATAWPPATPPAWAGANAWALLPPRAPALPVTAAEEMRAEAWARLVAGSMAPWQSRVYLSRWFRQNPPPPVVIAGLVVPMMREPGDGQLHLFARNGFEGLLGVDVRLPGRPWRLAVEQGNPLMYGRMFALEGAPAGPVPLGIRLRAKGKTVYETTLVLDAAAARPEGGTRE